MTSPDEVYSARDPAVNRGRQARRRVVDGLLLLDKPTGLTSNRALQQVKRLFGARKAGHTGSLDPLASGMLPLCFGQATKVSAYLLNADKTYRVTARIGVKTDTGDADGQPVAETGVALSRERLESALAGLRGEIQQVPPMYSALKQGGRRLYELAREGKEVERAPRTVTIHELALEHFDPCRPRFRVHCSKGTYVRTLIESIAEAAGTLGHVAELRRLAVEPFAGEPMVEIRELEAAAAEGPDALDRFLLPVDRAIADWPALHLDRQEAFYLLNGHPVTAVRGQEPGLVRLYDDAGQFLGIGEGLPDGRVAPKRLFVRAGVRGGD